MEQVKRAGGLSGVSPLPRELDYPLMKGDRWHDLYDMIKFPAEASNKPHDTIQSVSSEPSTKGYLTSFLVSFVESYLFRSVYIKLPRTMVNIFSFFQ